MRGPGSRPSLLFQLVVPATAVFIITILSLIAVLFSDERAPLAQWLNKNGNLLLLAELHQAKAHNRLKFAAMLYPGLLFLAVAGMVLYIVISLYAGYLGSIIKVIDGG